MATSAVSDTGWLQSSSAVSGSISPQKKGRSRQSGTPWTRSGCLTCKKRRKGCDKAKPSCNNCLKQGRTCEGYGDLWVAPLSPSAQVFKETEGRKRRLISFSPSNPSSPSALVVSDLWCDSGASSAPITPGRSVPSSPQCRVADIESEDLILDHTSQKQFPKHDTRTQDELSLVPRPSRAVSHLSGHESHYLQYHMEFGSRLLANLESEDNPLRSFLIPRAMSSPLLMKAVCAVSALHLANRSHGFEAQNSAVDFYGRTLGGLREALADHSKHVLPDDAMLAVGLMCKYEIVRGSVKQWVVHLSALQRLIASRGGLGSMERNAAQFLRGLYVYAYNMARISNRKHISYADPADTDIGTPVMDIYIGYTEELLKLCARISELPSLEGDVFALRLAVASINDSLLSWSSSSIDCIIPQNLTTETLTRLQLVAECFRDAGVIYLHSMLKHMGIASTMDDLEDITPGPSKISSLISTPKSTAIHRLLSRVQKFPLDDHCEFSALTFPLFIAGSESDVFAHRDLVLQSLDKLQQNFGIGNVPRAKDVLRILWARQDAEVQDTSGSARGGSKVHWLDILEELQWELILA
ncbi:hypothetical protein N7462_006248 [Penicillium macrosclerotiorum]|uniref:uncharacterized protein n=1 Tax=Penicillium macrosclerotiorum TaxID=303699 RepID=UPI00254886BF|nr:uncharacterized protein N7462_006248 [Penicillium macrosclerotiorum]KAJ5683083.1 hypothetical protein N7462_006248 [Penicillium macrosclerotiorum]